MGALYPICTSLFSPHIQAGDCPLRPFVLNTTSIFVATLIIYVIHMHHYFVLIRKEVITCFAVVHVHICTSMSAEHELDLAGELQDY